MPTPKHLRSDPPGRHRGPDQPGDTTTSRGEPRSKPAKERRAPSYRRTPVEILPPWRPGARSTDPAPRKRIPEHIEKRAIAEELARQRRQYRDAAAGAVGGEGAEYARRAAIRASAGGKPSTVARGTAGAAAGAASGAAIGSVVPGIGTAIGAGTGAVVGGAGGAISGAKAKKAYRRSLARADTAGPRRLLVAEFLIATVIAALSPLTDEDGTEKPGTLMKRLTAIAGLFFVLGLVSAAGRGAARAAAGFGGLLTVALLISQRSLLVKLADVFGGGDAPAPTSQGRPHPPIGPRPEGVGV